MKYFGCAWYPEAWPRERWAEDIRQMKNAGLNAVRLGEFNWGKWEAQEGSFDFSEYHFLINELFQNGISTLLCTPTAAPPKWMSRNYPETVKMNLAGQRVYDGNRRHYCPSSPKFREFSRTVTQRLADAFQHCPGILGWQLDNEIAAEAEHGFCYCPGCIVRFQQYLREKYRTPEMLNNAWNGAFWSGDFASFDEVDPRQFKRVCRMAEYAQFMSSLYTEFAYEQRDILKAVNPEWTITTNSWTSFLPDVAPDEIYDGLDFASCDTYLRNDSLAFYHSFWDYYRNVKGKPLPFTIGETGAWNRVTNHKNSLRILRSWAWDAFAHGAENLFYFRWRQSLMGEEDHPSILPWSGNPGEAYRVIAETSRELRAFSKQYPDLPPPENKVVILVERLTGYITKYRNDYSYFHAVVRMNQALNELGVSADILPASKVSDETLRNYQLVILPQMEYVPDSVCRALEHVLQSGGKLFAQCRLNRMDEYGKFRPESAPANLKKMFGLHIDESCEIRSVTDFGPFDYKETKIPADNRSLAQEFLGEKIRILDFMEKLTADRCRVLETYSEGLYQSAPIFTECDGAFYFGAPADHRTLLILLKHILRNAGIPIREIPTECQRIQRGKIVFYINNTSGEVYFREDGISVRPYDVLWQEIN